MPLFELSHSHPSDFPSLIKVVGQGARFLSASQRTAVLAMLDERRWVYYFTIDKLQTVQTRLNASHQRSTGWEL